MLCNMGRLDISYFEINQDDFGLVHIRNRENNKQFGLDRERFFEINLLRERGRYQMWWQKKR